MSNSHGELFGEIGKLVLAANSGQAIDLGATARDLAARYGELGISEETIANTVARSIGAIGMAMTHVADGGSEATREAIRIRAAELPERTALALARRTETASSKVYGNGLSARQKAEAIARITYPGLDLSHLHVAALSEAA